MNGVEQKAGAQQVTEKTDRPSYKDVLDAVKQKQVAEREAKERQLQKKMAANPEEYLVKQVLDRVPSGDVKISPSKEATITYLVPQDDVVTQERPTISFPALSEKPLAIDALVVAFKATGARLDGSQVITLKRCAQDIQDAIIVEVQEGKSGNWEYLYNKAVELEAIAQEQINGRLPMLAEKTEALPQTGVTLNEIKAKKIVPHMIRDRSEMLRKSLEEMPAYQHASLEAREEAQKLADSMEKELSSATPVDFINQVLQQEAQFLSGDHVSFTTSEANTVNVFIDEDGKIAVSLPANMDMTHVIQLAGEFSRLFPGHTSSDTRIGQFAQQLENTALLLAQQGGFSDETLEAVYNTGQQLKSLLSPDDKDLAGQKTFAEIQEEADTKTFTREERQKLITEMLLGRGIMTTGQNGQLQQSPFERLYSRWEQYHPGESEETFIKEYLEPKNYRLDFLKPYIEASTKKGGKAYEAMQEVAQQRAHESITQTQVDSWIEAVRGASGIHDVEFTQTIHAALADARAALERTNKMRAVLGEPLVTVEEAKIREIEAITTLMQSPDIANKLTYAPADIRALLAMSEPPLGEESLWDAACNIKAAYAKAAFEKLGFAVGMKRDGTHRYLLIKVGAKGEERVIEVDVTTPRKMEVNGEMMFLSGIQEITDQADIQNALLDISQDDSNQILISSIYNNVAMQIRKNGGDPQIVESFLTMAMQSDQKNDAAAYGLFILTGDVSMQKRALQLNPHIAEQWQAEKGFIGAYLDTAKIASVPQPTVSDPVLSSIVLDAGSKGAANLIDLDYIRNKQLQVTGLIGNSGITNPPDVLTVIDYFNQLEGKAISVDKAEQKIIHDERNESHLYDGIEEVDKPNAKDANDYVRDVIKNPSHPPRDLAKEQTIVKNLNIMIDKNSLDSDQYPRILLELAGNFDETRERVLNQILFKSFEDPSELNDYDISFYADPRYRKMHSSFKTAAIWARARGDEKAADDYMDRYNFYVGLRTAVKVSHGMNKLVNVGEIGALSKVAQEMNKEHFALMAQVPGQGYIMELYEKEYTRIIARDKRVTPAGYAEIKLNVQEQMKSLNKKGIVRSQFENDRGGDYHMEEWEVQRAYSAGRAMFNMFLRSSMHISFSQIADGVASGTSYPQGRIVESLNPWDTVFERWQMGSEWGGTDFVKQDTTEWYKAMKDYNYIQGINRIYLLGNKSIDSIQKAAQLKFVDFLSGMRINNIAFPVIYTDDPENPAEQISLKTYLDKNMKDNINIDKLQEDANDETKSKTDREVARVALNKALCDLVDKTDLGLGALLVHPSFLNTGTGNSDRVKSSTDTYEARVHLWKKVARTNLPQMADYLTGLEFVNRDGNGVVIKEIDPLTGKQKTQDIKDRSGNIITISSIEEILYEKWFKPQVKPESYTLKNLKEEWKILQEPIDKINDAPELQEKKGKMQKWLSLRAKMEQDRIIFEQKAMLKNKDSKMSKAYKENSNCIETPGLDIENAEKNKTIYQKNDFNQNIDEKHPRFYTEEEIKIVEEIQNNGQLLAGHLADIYWNNTPFLDIPLEEVDYKQLGSDEYRRKVAGDHSQLYTAFNSLVAIAKKPASQDAKTFAENMKGIVDNLEDVDGGLVAQQNAFPLTKIVMEWKMMSKGSRFYLLHNIKNLMNQPNSKAQELQGIHAEALDEFGTNDEIDDLMKAGIITPYFARKLKKELGTSMWNLIWNIIRDAGIMMPYVLAEPFVGEAIKFE